MSDVWENLWAAYRKKGLSEEEICDRIICVATKVIEGRKGLDECDKK